MVKIKSRVVLLMLAAGMTACADGASTPIQDVSSPSIVGAQVVIPVAAESIVALGRTLHVKLREATTRLAVARAMDESPYVEWRIALRRVIEQVAPDEATAALASNLRQVQQLESLIRKLPELELYLPFQDQRRAWDGSELVDIAVRFPQSNNGLLISADGSERIIVGGVHFSPANPMLVLAESEVDFADSESAVRGGRRSGRYRDMSRLTRRAVEPNAQCQGEDCDGDGGGGGGGPPVYNGDPYHHTRLYNFYMLSDHDFPWGLNELEFFGDLNGHYRGCVRYTGIAAGYLYTVADTTDYLNTLATAVADSTVDVTIKVNEDDDEACVDKSGDDDLGTDTFGISAYNTSRGSEVTFVVKSVLP